MMHGIRVSMAKGATKKILLKQDESLTATERALESWKTSLNSLLNTLLKNEAAWASLFSTYTSFQSICTSIYSARDTGAHAFLKDVKETEAQLEVPVDGLEPVFNARQRMVVAKHELKSILERIDLAQKLHLERFDTIRQHKYYNDKTRQMLSAESKRRAQQKDIDRRVRNQQKVEELAAKVSTITTQLFTELEALNQERVSVADSALSAAIFLQKHHFGCNPIKPAVISAENIGLGVRTPQTDAGFWNPSPNNTQASLTSVPLQTSSHDVPYPAPPPYAPGTYNADLHTASYPAAATGYVPSAPPVHEEEDYASGHYVTPPITPSGIS